MDTLQILILGLVQGAAELLPISSSAHVILAEKLMGLDPTTPEMTLLLVMLHTGTMFAVILYFWNNWKAAYFSSKAVFMQSARYIIGATAVTGVIGLILLFGIKYLVAHNNPDFEIENLFGNLNLMAASLIAAGVFIFYSGSLPERDGILTMRSSLKIGAVQGLCLPFRGFSRSGATISTGLVQGISRQRAEDFSFALAVVLTPAVIVKEVHRLFSHAGDTGVLQQSAVHMLMPGLLGMVFSFFAGLLALRLLSNWLEKGRWQWFGVYCVLVAAGILWIAN